MTGYRGDEPLKGPDEAGGPNVAWFLAGTIERDRIENYILNPEHEIGGHKVACVWKSAFGIEQGDGELLERLIREQLGQAVPVERDPYVNPDDPGDVVRGWRLDISEFEGPNGNVGRVRTSWFLDRKRSDQPIMSTAFRHRTSKERKKRARGT